MRFMRIVKKYCIPVILMIIISLMVLMILTVLTYIYKWQAKQVLIGIYFTYILAGFVGGLIQRMQNKEEKHMSRKMIEAIGISIAFVFLLVVLSVSAGMIAFEFSSQFLLVWMLIAGSSCLGRIL